MKWCIVSIAAAVVVSVFLTHDYTTKAATAERVESVERALVQREQLARDDAQFNQQSNHVIHTAEKKGESLAQRSYKYVYLPAPAAECDCSIDPCWMCLDRAAVRGDDGADCPCGGDARMPASYRIADTRLRGLQTGVPDQQDSADGLRDSAQGSDRVGGYGDGAAD